MLLGVDVGGTFTDAVLVDDGSAVHTAKVPSTPSEESKAVLEAVALVLARAGARAQDVERFAHGMTVATNALLEGRTARTALLSPAGFTDVVELGRQNRAHLYELCQARPAPLVPEELRFGVPERMGPDGPLRVLEHAAAVALIDQLARQPNRKRSPCRCFTPTPIRHTSACSRASSRRCFRASTCRSPATSSARSASTSGPPRRFSTPRCLPCSAPICGGCRATRARWVSASRGSCSPREG